MIDDSALRRRIRQSIREGRLPARPAQQLWGGPGSGKECSACGQAVGPQELELELEIAEATAESVSTRVSVHPRCLHLWECVLQELAPVLSRSGEQGTLRGRELEAAEGAE
jgi:hypothetical protein